jgi:DNA primase
MNKVTVRLEISTAEFAKLLKLRSGRKSDGGEAPSVDSGPVELNATTRLLALVALHDEAARAWLLAEPWQRLLGDDPEAALLVKILGADLHVTDEGSIHAFLTTLDAAEEAVVSGLLGEKPPAHPMAIAHDCWRELERRQIRRRMEAIQARIRTPNLEFSEVAILQKEVLDLQKRLTDIARPLSPPL